MPTQQTTLEDVRAMGYDDGSNAARESGSAQEPDGGWDSWLINAIGLSKTCQLFGENPDDSKGGWSDAMKAKLQAYNDGCNAGARACLDSDV